MTGLRRKLLIAGVLAVAALPRCGQAAPATVPDFSGMWAHPSLPGMEPLASGPTSLVNLQRRNGRSNVLQLIAAAIATLQIDKRGRTRGQRLHAGQRGMSPHA